jgi:uncharacterized protein YndB with AHSA1/START domain
MPDILTFVLLALAIAIAGILIMASRRPDTSTITRSIAIKAPPERIFPLINTPRTFDTWNPFVKPDPAIKLTYAGPESGTGAKTLFDGNKQVGAGHLAIVESVPSRRIAMNLVMTRPFACDNAVLFTLEPRDNATTVTWTMNGRAPFIAKVMCTFFNMDKMVGGTFDKGLADLKAMAERSAAA